MKRRNVIIVFAAALVIGCCCLLPLGAFSAVQAVPNGAGHQFFYTDGGSHVTVSKNWDGDVFVVTQFPLCGTTQTGWIAEEGRVATTTVICGQELPDWLWSKFR